jgi:hypothetical protein
MNTDLQDLKYKEITEKIIKIFFQKIKSVLSVESVSHENIKIGHR